MQNIGQGKETRSSPSRQKQTKTKPEFMIYVL